MKNNLQKLLFFFALIISNNLFGQTAVQFIQNAADPAADSLDIYINGTLFFDNFAFRAATPFTDFPPGFPFDIGIAPGNSTSVNDTIKNIVY